MIIGSWVMGKSQRAAHFLADDAKWPFLALCRAQCRPSPKLENVIYCQTPICSRCEELEREHNW